jgi:NAD(P)-dependent dehydrogenase (short-subunit alcohol dehydrogenase family)
LPILAQKLSRIGDWGGSNLDANSLQSGSVLNAIQHPRQEFMARRMMQQEGITRDQARAKIAATLPANRFGHPEEFGQACAFICSAKAGFMTGQNLQLDGGSYMGLI